MNLDINQSTLDTLYSIKDLLDQAEKRVVISNIIDKIFYNVKKAITNLDIQYNIINNKINEMNIKQQQLKDQIILKKKTLKDDHKKLDHIIVNKTNELNILKTTNQHFINEEKLYFAKLDELKALKDLTLLPNNVIANLISYLTINEIYNCLLVCNRWYNIFNKDYIWYILCQNNNQLILSKKQQHIELQKEIELYASNVPKQIIINLKNIKQLQKEYSAKKESTIPNEPVAKGQMFEIGINYVQHQVDILKSQWEDLKSQQITNEEVITFLNKKLDNLSNKSAEKTVELYEFKEKSQKLSILKEQMSITINKQDQLLQIEEEKRASMLNQLTTILQQINMKIDALNNVQVYNDKKEEIQIDMKIDKLNKEKKILIKAIKQMQKEKIKLLEQLDHKNKSTNPFDQNEAQKKKSTNPFD